MKKYIGIVSPSRIDFLNKENELQKKKEFEYCKFVHIYGYSEGKGLSLESIVFLRGWQIVNSVYIINALRRLRRPVFIFEISYRTLGSGYKHLSLHAKINIRQAYVS